MSSRVLVTGGAGFIGSYLVDALIRQGRTVRCLLNSDGDSLGRYKPGVEYVSGNLLDPKCLEQALHGVDVVYHLAAKLRPAGVIERKGNLYTKVNVDGTKNLIEECLKHKIRKFIYFSSIAALGPGSGIVEESLPAPVTAYGQSKFAAEQCVMEYVQKRGFPATILRPGLVYGPGGPAILIVARIVKSGLVPVVGDGKNLVPLCFVADVVKAALLAEEKGRNGEAYFVVDRSYTTLQIIDAVARGMKKKIYKVHCPVELVSLGVSLKALLERLLQVSISPLKIDFNSGVVFTITNNWVCSNDKIVKEFGLSFEDNFVGNIAKTIDWYKDNNHL